MISNAFAYGATLTRPYIYHELWADSDPVSALITDNLVSSLNGIVVPYNGEDHIAVSGYQRAVDEVNCRYPYIEVCGPVGSVLSRSARREIHALDYTILVYIVSNDEGASDPITYQLRNSRAYVMAAALDDRKRGGHAVNTEYAGRYGHWFDEMTGEIVLFFGLRVTVIMVAGDPFSRVF